MAQVVEPQENEQKNEDAEEEMQEEVPEVPDVRYLDCSALAKWITESGDNANKTFLVVDVRDDDFGPKKIVDAINIPQHDLTNKYDTSSIVDLIEKKAKDIENIVFHCMYSQVRGPTSAKYYHRFRKNNYPKYHKQNVFILQGGYRWFLQQNPHYCENI